MPAYGVRVLRGPRARRPRGRRALGGPRARDPVRRRGHLRAPRTRTTSAAGSGATRTTTSSAASTSARTRPTRRSSVARVRRRHGRCAEVVAPYFDEVIGAARSGLFDTHRPPGLREALPGPARHAGAARRGARAVRAGPRGARRERARRSRSTRPGCASCRARRTRRPAIVARYRELGGRHVTIGSDAHRTEWFAYGLARGVSVAARRAPDSRRSRSGAGATADRGPRCRIRQFDAA